MMGIFSNREGTSRETGRESGSIGTADLANAQARDRREGPEARAERRDEETSSTRAQPDKPEMRPAADSAGAALRREHAEMRERPDEVTAPGRPETTAKRPDEAPAKRPDETEAQRREEALRRDEALHRPDAAAAAQPGGVVPGGGAAPARPATQPHHEGQELAALFAPDAAQRFRARWDAVQIGFVDDPARAVRDADELVAQVLKSLAESFASQRARIESDGRAAEGVSTEDHRVALRRYRSFFQRLLSL